MITLIYKKLYRSTEEGNWRVEETTTKEVTKEELEKMKASCAIIGAQYLKKHNEIWNTNVDRLHATRIIIKEEA